MSCCGNYGGGDCNGIGGGLTDVKSYQVFFLPYGKPTDSAYTENYNVKHAEANDIAWMQDTGDVYQYITDSNHNAKWVLMYRNIPQVSYIPSGKPADEVNKDLDNVQSAKENSIVINNKGEQFRYERDSNGNLNWVLKWHPFQNDGSEILHAESIDTPELKTTNKEFLYNSMNTDEQGNQVNYSITARNGGIDFAYTDTINNIDGGISFGGDAGLTTDNIPNKSVIGLKAGLVMANTKLFMPLIAKGDYLEQYAMLSEGHQRYNPDTKSVEVYDGTNWISNIPPKTLTTTVENFPATVDVSTYNTFNVIGSDLSSTTSTIDLNKLEGLKEGDTIKIRVIAVSYDNPVAGGSSTPDYAKTGIKLSLMYVTPAGRSSFNTNITTTDGNIKTPFLVTTNTTIPMYSGDSLSITLITANGMGNKVYLIEPISYTNTDYFVGITLPASNAGTMVTTSTSKYGFRNIAFVILDSRKNMDYYRANNLPSTGKYFVDPYSIFVRPKFYQDVNPFIKYAPTVSLILPTQAGDAAIGTVLSNRYTPFLFYVDPNTTGYVDAYAGDLAIRLWDKDMNNFVNFLDDATPELNIQVTGKTITKI